MTKLVLISSPFVAIVVLTIIAFAINKPVTAVATANFSPSPQITSTPAPTPVGINALEVGKVNPGNTVNIDFVNLSQEGYIGVYLDSQEPQIQIGKSEILPPGEHKNTTVNLIQDIHDGDVVYLRLYKPTETPILDINNNAIEVQKNVGMLMTHYHDEY